jgi:predicted MFS family arabinose efflux permease
MASGVISAGFAAGLMLGPLLSTSVILPALGGWRQVFVCYGVVAVIVGLVWLVVHPVEPQSESDRAPRVSLGDSLRYVVRLRGVWILGIGGLGINACIQGFSGYLPTYLKAVGWADLDADRALAAFFMASLTAVIPLSILSDRYRLRRGFLIAAACILAVGVSLLSVADGALIILVLAATGFCFDSFMAVLNASVLEADGMRPAYVGTAIGLATMIRNLGGTFSPPLGNGLAVIGPNFPFLVWGSFGLFAVLVFIFALKSKKRRTGDITAADPARITP